MNEFTYLNALSFGFFFPAEGDGKKAAAASLRVSVSLFIMPFIVTLCTAASVL